MVYFPFVDKAAQFTYSFLPPVDRISVTLFDSVVRIRILSFFFISYGKLAPDLPVLNMRDVFQICTFHVNREEAV
jgi:hypothetical protein